MPNVKKGLHRPKRSQGKDSERKIEPMRVSQISVKQLFNTFDHSIQLDLHGRITIIHGMNGLGKTTLLRMVKSLCGGRYRELQLVPFAELRIDFDDKTSIVIDKIPLPPEEQDHPKRQNRLVIHHIENGVEKGLYKPPLRIDPNTLRGPVEWFEHRIHGLDRLDVGKWHYRPTGEILSLDDVMERFVDVMPESFVMTAHNAPEWIKRINKGIHIRLIETQRLLSPGMGRTRQGYEPEIGPAIVVHSEELAARISRQEGEYGVLSQSLDRSFPMRYVQQKTKISLTDEQLRDRFRQLESKRSRLEEAGLLEKEVTGFELPPDMDNATREVMSIYVQDIEKKLSVFDDLAPRIDLFRKIVNGHFIYKELRASKKKGFLFFSTRTGEELDSKDLSSGEQHEVVLLYELLFHVVSNTLIMIDEPEISLHIAWQEEFLKDLQRIIELSPFDAVIATHSPQIVNDRWDLTVELTGPEEVNA